MNYSTSVLTAAHTTPAWKRITLPKVQHIAAPIKVTVRRTNATLTVRHLLTKGA